MGTNIYPSSVLLGQDKDAYISALQVDELIEKADGFAGVFPGRSFFCISIYVHVRYDYEYIMSHLICQRIISSLHYL